jgi:hypothetical protein
MHVANCQNINTRLIQAGQCVSACRYDVSIKTECQVRREPENGTNKRQCFSASILTDIFRVFPQVIAAIVSQIGHGRFLPVTLMLVMLYNKLLTTSLHKLRIS